MVNLSTLANSTSLVLNETSESKIFTTGEAAMMLRIPERRVRRLLERGVLNGAKIRGRFGDEWRIHPFDPQHITALLNSRNRSSASNHIDKDLKISQDQGNNTFCADPKKLDNDKVAPYAHKVANAEEDAALDESESELMCTSATALQETRESNSTWQIIFTQFKLFLLSLIGNHPKDRSKDCTTLPL